MRRFSDDNLLERFAPRRVTPWRIPVQLHPAFRNRRRGVSTWIHPPCSFLSLTPGPRYKLRGSNIGAAVELKPSGVTSNPKQRCSLPFLFSFFLSLSFRQAACYDCLAYESALPTLADGIVRRNENGIAIFQGLLAVHRKEMPRVTSDRNERLRVREGRAWKLIIDALGREVKL